MGNLRIIGGTAKGRRLKTVPGDSTRPILDRVRESLFNIERRRLPGTRWLDLFGGTGSVGLEALSEGAAHCTFVEIKKEAVQVIRENLTACGLEAQAIVRHTDAFGFLRQTKESFDRIFIAPPQYKALWIEALHHIAERPALVASEGQIIVQIDRKEYEPVVLNSFAEVDQRRYGNSLLLWFA